MPLPSPGLQACERTIETSAVSLALEDAGAGEPIVLLHGLTATRRYVVMGSRTLERSGYRVLAYDARGHGRSSPAPSPGGYEYADLVDDLVALLDSLGITSAVLAGASMGAHTALALALRAPHRCRGLVVITPGYDPEEHDDPDRLARWDALADGLEHGGTDGFLAAYGEGAASPAWQGTLTKVIRQRLALHEHTSAVADALRVVPRSRPFAGLEELGRLSMPVTVVASGDDADPGHPEALAVAYAEAVPGARLLRDEPGRSPLAWRGSELSRVIAEVASAASG